MVNRSSAIVSEGVAYGWVEGVGWLLFGIRKEANAFEIIGVGSNFKANKLLVGVSKVKKQKSKNMTSNITYWPHNLDVMDFGLLVDT
jgi:acylphosphatase